MMRQFELVELVKSYDPNADEDAINRAYVFSMKAHGAQMRASGDPYFSHPVEVAGVLARMKLDTASIVTGLLHDTVEDTVATPGDVGRHPRAVSQARRPPAQHGDSALYQERRETPSDRARDDGHLRAARRAD